MPVRASQDNDTPSSSHRSAPSSTKLWIKVLNQVQIVRLSKKYESDSFMDSGTYCQVCNGSNVVTSKCRTVKEETHFVKV